MTKKKSVDLSTIKPEDFREHIGENAAPEVLHHVATHPETEWHDHHIITEHPNSSPDTLRHMHKLATDQLPSNLDDYDKNGVKERLLDNPNTPKDVIESQHNSLSDSWIGNHHESKVAFHPSIPFDKVSAKFKEKAGDRFQNLRGREHTDVRAVNYYLKHPGMNSEHLQGLIDSSDPEIAHAALTSKHATSEQQIKGWGNSNFTHSHRNNFVRHDNLHPEAVQHIHDDLRSKMQSMDEAGETDSRDYGKAHNNLAQLLRHKNLSPEMQNHYLQSPNSDFKESIIRNPSLPMDKLHPLAAAGDTSAIGAIFERGSHDVTPEILKDIHKHIPASNEKYQSGHQASLLRHPNTPDDILKERANIGAYPSYKILERKDLSTDVLKHLVDHKTKGVALEALSHPNVNKEVIDHALKRKMKDVNQKASLHPLAPKDVKYDKFLKDAKTVQSGFERGTLKNDPEFINQAADKHGHEPEIFGKLLSSPHISTGNVNKLLGHLEAADAERNALSEDDPAKSVADLKYRKLSQGMASNSRGILEHQDKYDSNARKLLVKHYPYAAGELKDLSPEEMEHGLEHWNGKDQGQATGMAEALFHHDNLSPDLAKSFLQGKYGHISSIDDGNYRNDDRIKKTVHSKPEIFTDEVIKAGIHANPEFHNEKVTEALSSSPAFNPENWDEMLNRIKPGLDSTDDEKKRYNSVLKGMYANPNISEAHADAALKSEDFYEQALSNPKLKTKSIIDFVKMAQEDETIDHMDRYKRDAIGKALADRKDSGAAKVLEMTNDHRMAETILNNHPDQEKFLSKNFNKISKNSNHDVTKHIVNEYFRRLNNETRENLADKLFDHEDLGVRSAAFRHMSNDKKNEYMDKFGESDPNIIRGVDKQKLAKLKINPDSHPDVVRAILDNNHVNDEHLKDAIDHSPGAAQIAMRHAFNRMSHEPYLETVRKHYSKEKQERYKAANAERKAESKKIKAGARSLIDRVTEKHAENAPIMKEMYDRQFGDRFKKKTSTEIKNVHNMLDNERIPEEVKSHILRNDPHAFESHHLERFKDSESPDMADAMSRAVNLTPELFKHLVGRATPDQEYYYATSRHVKDADPETLKKLAGTKNNDVKVSLAENQFTPANIKTELFKDPHVLLTARGNSATDNHLDHILDNQAQTDHSLLEKIAKHGASTDDLRSKVVKIAAKHIQALKDDDKTKDGLDAHEGHEILQRAIHNAVFHLKDGKLHGEAQQLMAQHGKYDTVKRYLGKNQGKTIDDKAAQIIHDEWHDGIRGGFVEDLLNTRFKNPELSKKLIESGAAAGNHGYVANHITMNKHLGDDAHDLAYEGLKNSQEREGDYYGASELLKALMARGHSGITNELLSAHPDMVHLASSNKKIDGPKFKEAVHKAMEKIKDTGESLISDDGFNNILNNPHIDGDDLHKFYDISSSSHPNGIYTANKIKELIARNPKTKSSTLEDMANSGDSFVKAQALRNKNMPHQIVKDSIKRVIDNEHNYAHNNILESLMANPNVKYDDFKNEIEQRYPEGSSEHTDVNHNYMCTIMKGLSKNDDLNGDDLGKIYEEAKKKEEAERYFDSSNIIHNIRKNPNSPESLLRKMIENGDCSEGHLEDHPLMGGKLMREKKHEFPNDVPNLQKGNEINEVKYIPKQEKFQAAIDSLPPEGMDWASFKKAQPKLAGDPDIQKMFTSQKSQKCNPELGKEYLSKQPGNHFHISYRTWTGMQRHDVDHGADGPGKPQLVIQVNNSQEHDNELSKNPKLFKLYKFAQKSSNYSGHPTGSHTLAWSRIDTSNPEHWFIDEAQSDMNSSLSKGLKEIEETGQSGSLQRQYGISAEEAQELLPALSSMLKNWEKAAMNTAIELAKKHGVKQISMHSGESKTAFNKAGQEVTNKYNKIYNEAANAVGLNKKVPYATIHNHNKVKGGHHPIWTMDLTGKKEDVEKSESKQRKGKSKVQDILDSLIKIEIDNEGRVVQRRHKVLTKEEIIARMKAREHARRTGTSSSLAERLLRNKDK